MKNELKIYISIYRNKGVFGMFLKIVSDYFHE